MKITNIILGVVCALVIGLAAFLYVQKTKAANWFITKLLTELI